MAIVTKTVLKGYFNTGDQPTEANFTNLVDSRPNLHVAAVDPTANDDSGDGHEIGDLWLNTATPTIWSVSDVTATAAVWTNITAGGGSTLPVADTTGIAKGSVDATKIIRLEVDGLTTATTRVWTVQDVDGTVLVTGGSDVPIADGGTGASTAQAAIDALTAVSGATNEHVLTKDTGTGNAKFKEAPGAYTHPNHSGEVTSVADGAQTIINDAVTYAKMQNVSATDKVLGRVTAGAGDVEEIACTAAGRALLDDANAAAQRTTLSLGNVENTAHSTDAHTMTIDGRDVSVDGTKLDGVEAAADVTDAANVNAAGAVMEADYNAQTILQATSDNTPVALTVGEQRIVGRITSGNITALTGAQVMALLSGQAGADFSMGTQKITAVVDPTTDQEAATKKYVDVAHKDIRSSGYVSGGAVTDNADGTVDVAAGVGYIRAADDATTDLLPFTWSLAAGLTFSTGLNVLIVEYNGGSPQVVSRTSAPANFNTEFDLATVIKESATVLHITEHPHRVNDAVSLIIQRFHSGGHVQRDIEVGGLIIGESGDANRYVTMSAGRLWVGLNKYTIAAIDTNPGGGADTFEAYYRDGGAGFTKVSAQTAWDFDSRDDGSGGLDPMAANKYGSLHWWLETDGQLVCMYGYIEAATLTVALTTDTLPSIPVRLQEHGIYIGRIIFKTSTTPAVQVDSNFTDPLLLLGSGVSQLTDLSDVSATTGSGSTVPFNDTPTLLTPTIASFANAAHDHEDAAGGAQLSLTAAVTGVLPVANGGTNRSAAPVHPLILTAAGGMGTSTSGGGDADKLPEQAETTTNKVNYHYLAMATGESVFWNIPMPLNWDAGTFTATFLWTAPSGSNDIKFEIKGISFANSDALDTAMGAAQSVEDTLITNGDVHISSATSAITLAGTPAAGEYVCVEVKRVAPGGVDLVGDVHLLGVRIAYTAAGYSES